MKKVMYAVLAFVCSVSIFLVGCSKKAAEPGAKGDTALKVGMVTDSGSIDDKSFNQGTWEGIKRAENDFDVDAKYLKPTGTTEADYTKEIGNLVDADYKFIVTPGFKFETAIFHAQDKYTNARFVLIDGAPHNADYSVFNTASNTVSIFFAEQEAGFLAGVAASLSIKEGQMGFVGGMEIPPVQKFNWGYQQGVAYANKNLGTKIVLDPKNIIYQGTFSDVAAGQQLAASMFDSGVKVIFAAAGGVGVGVINEGKSRAKAGQDIWVVGVDVDQYSDGEYAPKKSVILTSAMKRIDNAAYDMVKADLNGSFPGGQKLLYNAHNNGIGIPRVNPNLTTDIENKVAEILDQMKAGKIVVSDKQGDLVK